MEMRVRRQDNAYLIAAGEMILFTFPTPPNSFLNMDMPAQG